MTGETMNSSRRIACKLCRDRKVRCDGEQPSCQRCLRAGETCVYTPTSCPTKADLLQTIESLRARVGKCPFQLIRFDSGLTSLSCLDMTETSLLRQHQMLKGSPHLTPPMPESAMSLEYADCLLDPCLPSPRSSGDPLLGPDPTDSSFFHSYVPHNPRLQHVGPQSDSLPFSVDAPLPPPPLPSPTTAPTRSSTSHSHIPPLREIRALNSPPGSSYSPPLSSLPQTAPEHDDPHHQERQRMLSSFTGFATAAFSTQAEIAGIGSVVAEYLAWVRKTPGRMGRGAAADANWMGVLETLEMRVREVHDMAETRNWAAWEGMMNDMPRTEALEGVLHACEGQVHERTEKIRRFFQECYDVNSALSEQMIDHKAEPRPPQWAWLGYGPDIPGQTQPRAH